MSFVLNSKSRPLSCLSAKPSPQPAYINIAVGHAQYSQVGKSPYHRRFDLMSRTPFTFFVFGVAAAALRAKSKQWTLLSIVRHVHPDSKGWVSPLPTCMLLVISVLRRVLASP
jgi:hypothetical protein